MGPELALIWLQALPMLGLTLTDDLGHRHHGARRGCWGCS